MIPLEYILVTMTSSYHSEKNRTPVQFFWKGGLFTGFTGMVKIGLETVLVNLFSADQSE